MNFIFAFQIYPATVVLKPILDMTLREEQIPLHTHNVEYLPKQENTSNRNQHNAIFIINMIPVENAKVNF